MKLVRTRGFSATSVEELCSDAGVTKGAFFHHFPSKDALGEATAGYWSEMTGAFFGEAPFQHHARALDRVMGYIDLRIALLSGLPETFTCVAGTMVQERFADSPAIRSACQRSIMGNAAMIEPHIAAALQEEGIAGCDAASLARHIQAVIQGAFILAKTQAPEQAAAMAREQLLHLRHYFSLLFGQSPHAAPEQSAPN